VKSYIDMNEKVENKGRHVAADSYYFPCYVHTAGGMDAPALFTEEQLKVALERAVKNSEDVPERAGWFSRMYRQLFL